jgi:hypothetical protein
MFKKLTRNEIINILKTNKKCYIEYWHGYSVKKRALLVCGDKYKDRIPPTETKINLKTFYSLQNSGFIKKKEILADSLRFQIEKWVLI